MYDPQTVTSRRSSRGADSGAPVALVSIDSPIPRGSGSGCHVHTSVAAWRLSAVSPRQPPFTSPPRCIHLILARTTAGVRQPGEGEVHSKPPCPMRCILLPVSSLLGSPWHHSPILRYPRGGRQLTRSRIQCPQGNSSDPEWEPESNRSVGENDDCRALDRKSEGLEEKCRDALHEPDSRGRGRNDKE